MVEDKDEAELEAEAEDRQEKDVLLQRQARANGCLRG